MRLPSKYILKNPQLKSAEIMHQILLKNDPNEQVIREQMAESLKSMNPQDIFIITSFHRDLRDFCRQQIDTQVVWSKKLLQGKYPSMAIYTLDGHYITIYDLLMGAYLYSEFLNEKSGSTSRGVLIKMATQWRSYYALQAKLRNKIKYLENLTIPFDENKKQILEKTIQDILQVSDTLSFTYWQAGFLQAGSLLNQLVNGLSNKILIADNIKDEDKKLLLQKAEDILKVSVKYFLCAAELEKNEFSKKILIDVTQGKGVLGLFSKDFFSSWDGLKSILKSWIDNESYHQVEDEAKQLIESKLNFITKHESDITPINEDEKPTLHQSILPIEIIRRINTKCSE